MSDEVGAEETLIAAFFEAHERAFPHEPEKRERLRAEPEKLIADAGKLLALVSVSDACDIVRRDMSRLAELGKISPVTMRFCMRSVESRAKVSARGVVATGQSKDAARASITAGDFSHADYRRICAAKDESGKNFGSLSDAQRWRWHAYMRVWRANMGFRGPPPFDERGEWRDGQLDRWALMAWHEKHPEWRRTEPLDIDAVPDVRAAE